MANLTVNIAANAQPATQEVDNLSNSLNNADTSTENLNKNLGKTADESDKLEGSLKNQEARIKTLDGVINIAGGSVELLAAGLVGLGIASEEDAGKLEALALGAISFADGTKRVLDGYKTLSEGRKLYQEIVSANTATEKINTTTLVANAEAGAAISATNRIAATSIGVESAATDVNTAKKGLNTAATYANVAATKALAVAQKLIPWVAIGAAIFAAASYIINLASSEDAATRSTERLNDELERQNRAIAAVKTAASDTISLAQAQGKSQEDLLKIELQAAKDVEEAESNRLARLRVLNKFSEETENARIEAVKAEQARIIAQAKLDTYYRQQREAADAKAADAAKKRSEDNKRQADQDKKDAEREAEQNAKNAEAAFKAEQDYYDRVNQLLMDEESKRILAVAKQYDDLIEQAAQYGYDTTELEKQRVDAIQKVIDDANAQKTEKQKQENQKQLDEDKAFRQQLQDLAVDSALGTITALKDLNSIFDSNNEKAAQAAFNREKALNLAETIISTYSSAQKAYSSQLIPGDPSSVVRAQIAAAVAIAGGLARVAIISKQKYEPNNPSASGAGAAGGGGAATARGGFAVPASGGFNPTNISAQNLGLGGIGGRVQTNGEPEAIRAYVMSGDVMSATQASTNINRRRTLTNG